jgi:hypothetical protein
VSGRELKQLLSYSLWPSRWMRIQHVVRLRVDHTFFGGGLCRGSGRGCWRAWKLSMGGVHRDWGGPYPWVVTESVGRLAEAGWRWSFLLPCGVGCVCFYVDVHALWLLLLLLCIPVTAQKCQRHHLWCNGFVWCCVLLCRATACGVSASQQEIQTCCLCFSSG